MKRKKPGRKKSSGSKAKLSKKGPAKKPKKKSAGKPIKKSVRKPVKRKPAMAPSISPKGKKQEIKGKLIGRVSHYFAHVQAAAFKIDKGGLRVGDTVHIKGHTTDFKQLIQSMQIDHVPVEKAGVGDDVGIQVNDRVREHDAVYKVSG